MPITRTRIRSHGINPIVDIGVWPYVNPEVWTSPMVGTFVPKSKATIYAGFPNEESFTDDPSSYTGFKPCRHEEDIGRVYTTTPLCPTGNVASHNYWLKVLADDVEFDAAEVSPVSWDFDKYVEMSLAYMLPHMNEGLSLVNFLLELKDLKSWKKVQDVGLRLRAVNQRTFKSRKFKGLEQTQRLLEENPLYTKELIKTKAGRLLIQRDVMRRLTGAHLEASFGIVPFVADLMNMHVQLSAFQRRLNNLRQHAGRRLVRHYRKTLPLEDVNEKAIRSSTAPWTTIYNRSSPVSGYQVNWKLVKTQRWVVRPVFHATLRYSYELPSMHEAEAEARAYLDMLGVRLDPSIVWNATKYSFLVDWIIDVSGFLSRFAKDNYPIKPVIYDYCWSIKYHRECSLTAVYQYPASSAFNPPPWWDGSTAQVDPVFFNRLHRYYERKVGIPVDWPSIETRRPRLKHAALAGSLFTNKGIVNTKPYRKMRGR